jgi:hypothetical protein
LEELFEHFSFPKLSHCYWDPHSLSFNGYRVLYRVSKGKTLKLAAHLHLVAKLRISGVEPIFTLHDFMA